ncbi:MAG: DUF1003 domain-containing protein [Candidatus Nanopelagicales bacterium]|nr:DUF1003 domain-containing protein [Candidatus Nanopelagicales bacterium]MCF8543382.1 DUF1003 domain-containing protein [Candidatus Nanopelagicales bacterium]MCF8557628.1 DUF1003 domain-containing protein [Candidatus Nanopelagicales bacterium]
MASHRARRSARIDQPLDRSRSLRPSVDTERFGRLSERAARGIGSWAFILWMTIAIIIWIGINIAIMDGAPDPFPFIFLTLLLSLQASYAAPLILLAQNRQTDRDRVQFAEDRQRTERLLADSDYLARELAALRQAIGDVATRDYVRGELRELSTDLRTLLDLDDEGSPAGKSKKERKPPEAPSPASE